MHSNLDDEPSAQGYTIAQIESFGFYAVQYLFNIFHSIDIETWSSPCRAHSPIVIREF